MNMAKVKFKELHEDGRDKETGTLIDGVKQGRFVAYEYFEKTEDQVIESEYLKIQVPGRSHRVEKKIGFYVDGIANGDYQIFLNNTFVEEGTFIDGLAEGEFKMFHHTLYPFQQIIKQNIIQRINQRLRKKNIKMQGNYKNGRLHGEIREFFPYGESYPYEEQGAVWISDLKEGLLHGRRRHIGAKGNLIRIIPFEKGYQNGIEKEYNEDGRLMSLTTWKDGVRHGPYRERELSYPMFDYTGEIDLTLERGMYVNGEKKGKYIKYWGPFPLTPKKEKENIYPCWEKGVHE